MKLKDILILSAGIILIAGPILLPVAGAGDDWPTYEHDSGRTGFSTVNAPDTNATLWNLSINGSAGYNLIHTPVVAGGKAFFGCDNGKIYAADADTGAMLFNLSTGSSPGIAAAPVVAGNMLYIGDNNGVFHAFDIQNRTEKWNFTASGAINTSPLISDGRVYFGTSYGNFLCLNASDGAEDWNLSFQGGIYSSPALGNGMVFFPVDFDIFALNALNGTMEWRFSTEGTIFSSPAYYNSTVFFGSADGKFYAVNAETGEEKWNFSVGDSSSASAIGYHSVFFGSDDGYFYSLKIESGHLIWKRNLTDYGGYSAPAIADGKVYAATESGEVYALNALTGNTAWSFKAQSQQETVTDFAIGANKGLYLGMGNTLYCFGKENIPPYMNFVSVENTGEDYTIQWRAGDEDGDSVKVSLLYGEERTIENATLIADSLSSSGSFVWNISRVVAGDYYLIGRVSDGFDENVSFYPVSISHPSPPAPTGKNYTLKILSHRDGEKVSGNITVRILAGTDLVVIVVYMDGEGMETRRIFEGWNEGEIAFTLDTAEYRNGDYTLRAKGYYYSANETDRWEERKPLNETSITIHVENEYVPVEALAAGSVTGAASGAGISAFAGKRGGRFRLKGVKSATKKKRQLSDNPVLAAVSVIVALISLIAAYAYAQVVSPKKILYFLKSGLDVQGAVMSSSHYLLDLTPAMVEVIPYIAIAIGAVIAVRLLVDRISTKLYGMDSTYRLQLPGLISLALTSALFATPFGYPGKSVHEIPEGREEEFRKREGWVASARVFGTLSLLIPFYLLKNSSFLIYEVGTMLVLMTTFFLSLPLRDYEGKHLYLWNKGAWAGIFLFNTGLFYGWQLLLIPDESVLIGGIIGLIGVVLSLRCKAEQIVSNPLPPLQNG